MSYQATGPAVVPPTSDSELHAAKLTHTDRAARKPWRCKLTQRYTIITLVPGTPSLPEEIDKGQWEVESGRWEVEGGRWEVKSGRWRVGGWEVESGRWRVGGENMVTPTRG